MRKRLCGWESLSTTRSFEREACEDSFLPRLGRLVLDLLFGLQLGFILGLLLDKSLHTDLPALVESTM
jgi:hypothetical protein